ncbi:conserved protein of unknown function [Paraburkholderia dioscoreae]|uniref:Uncharacterized protein n=1 Tax=Paraburkholderia dioscoreae TaxID=2604047 RepID=A0A5Q4ZTV9_9BURK|nr:conserved protein of unknown function [Paraburkholderia dioscoreae]
MASANTLASKERLLKAGLPAFTSLIASTARKDGHARGQISGDAGKFESGHAPFPM